LAGALLVSSAASLWGCWSLVLRGAESLAPIHPAVEVSVVLAIIFLAMLPLALRRPRAFPRTLGPWLLLAAYGGCAGANSLLYFWAMQKTTIAVAVLTHYLAPVLVALSAPLILGEARRAGTWSALALSLGGLTIMLEPWSAGTTETSWVGAALGAFSALFYAATVLIAKRLGPHFTPEQVVAGHAPWALVVVLPMCPADGFALPLSVYGVLAAGSVVLGALSGVLFLRGLARVEADLGSVLTLLEPLVAVMVGVFVWREPLGLTGAFGAVLVLGGAFRVLRSASRADRELGAAEAPEVVC
jgi:drug/metabolite transporter (DMT)-like permease